MTERQIEDFLDDIEVVYRRHGLALQYDRDDRIYVVVNLREAHIDHLQKSVFE